jgi:hypothetical protein
MGDWCGSVNESQTNEIEIVGVEKDSGELEPASACHPAKARFFE